MSLPRGLLHIEGFVMLVLAVVLYMNFVERGWVFFALLLFAPDLVFIIYALHKRAGIIAYNVVHTYSAPILLGLVALALSLDTVFAVAVIWGAHIGMDRTVGYGLKYSVTFKDTHFGRV